MLLLLLGGEGNPAFVLIREDAATEQIISLRRHKHTLGHVAGEQCTLQQGGTPPHPPAPFSLLLRYWGVAPPTCHLWGPPAPVKREGFLSELHMQRAG